MSGLPLKVDPLTEEELLGPLDASDLAPELQEYLGRRFLMLDRKILASQQRVWSWVCEPCPEGEPLVGQYRSTDDTTDVNVDPPVGFGWNTTDRPHPDWSINGQGHFNRTAEGSGTYLFHVNFRYFSAATDVGVKVQLVKNVTTLAGSATGYIRGANGHNHGNSVLELVVTAAQNDVIKIQVSQGGAAGTATQDAGESVVIIKSVPTG